MNPITPQPEQKDYEPILDNILMSQNNGVKQTNAILENVFEQGEKLNTKPILEESLNVQKEAVNTHKEIGSKIETAIQGIKGITNIKFDTKNVELIELKGEKGDDGKTPSSEELLSLIHPLIPVVKDGHTPTESQLLSLIQPLIPEVKDGETPSDERILSLIQTLIPEVKDGEDGEDGETPTTDELVSLIKPLIPVIKNGKNGKDGSPDTTEQILEKLKGKLPYSYIKDTPTFFKGSSKTVSLKELDDVDLSSLSIINGKYVLGTGGAGTWGSITGTLSNQTDLQTALNAKQATLVSATNIKTVNGTTLLGSGDLATPQGTVTAVSVATANGFSGSSSGGATPALTIVAGAITPTTVNGVTLSGASTPTLAVTGTTTVSGANTGDRKQLPTYTVGATGADYTTIQGAIDTATAGGTIYLTDATYTITSTLLIKANNITIQGNGTTTLNFNGASVTTLIKTNSAATKYTNFQLKGVTITQTNATVQGVAIDASDMALCKYENLIINTAGTAISMTATQDINFYNKFSDIWISDCNNGILMTRSGAHFCNDNWFYNIRTALKAGGAGKGLSLIAGIANGFVNCNFEPGTGTGITGISIAPTVNGDVADTSFFNVYCEANATNVDINSNTQRTTFIGGQIIAGSVADLVDAGQHTQLVGTDVNFVMTNQFSILDTHIDNTNASVTSTWKNNTNFAHVASKLVYMRLLNSTDTSDLLNLENAGTGLTLNVKGATAYKLVTKTQLVANTNNYVIGGGTFFRVSTDASRDLTGILGNADGTTAGAPDGRQIILRNVGSFALVLKNASASSTAANRFAFTTGADITLAASDSITLMYDATSAIWFNVK